MAINKNFVVKNGLEVNTNQIFADSATGKVGIGSTLPTVELDVQGAIAATDVVSSLLRVTGYATFSQVQVNNDINVSGFSTVSNELNVLGMSSVTNFKVTGVSTFNENVTFDKDVRVAGFSTFVGVGTFQSDLYVGGDLYVADDLVFDEFTARNGNITGVGTITYLDATDTDITNLAVSGLATVSTLGDVGELVVVGTGDTLTNLGIATLSIAGLNVTGIVTATSFSGSGAGLTGVTASGGGTIGIRSDTNVISTATSTIDFKSTTGTAITAITDVTSGITTVTIQPGISIGLAIALGG